MGIKGLSKYIKDKCPGAIFSCSIRLFSGFRVAIDCNYVLHQYKAVARKKIIDSTDITRRRLDDRAIMAMWLEALLGFLMSWIENGVSPIIILDGDRLPDKESCSKERSEKLDECRRTIEQGYAFFDANPLSNNQEGAKILRAALLEYTTISKEEIEIFKSICNDAGIPVIIALNDAERLCSILCIEGKVAAVVSKDTDCIAHGCPLIITSFDRTINQNGELYVSCIRSDWILYGLNIDRQTLVDLAILCGCDYNGHVKGIGPDRAINHLRTYKNIEGVIKALGHKDDFSVLRHARCRELFSTLRSDDACHKTSKVILNMEKRSSKSQLMDSMGIGMQGNRIISSIHSFSPCFDGRPKALNIIEIPPYILVQ